MKLATGKTTSKLVNRRKTVRVLNPDHSKLFPKVGSGTSAHADPQLCRVIQLQGSKPTKDLGAQLPTLRVTGFGTRVQVLGVEGLGV